MSNLSIYFFPCPIQKSLKYWRRRSCICFQWVPWQECQINGWSTIKTISESSPDNRRIICNNITNLPPRVNTRSGPDLGLLSILSINTRQRGSITSDYISVYIFCHFWNILIFQFKNNLKHHLLSKYGKDIIKLVKISFSRITLDIANDFKQTLVTWNKFFKECPRRGKKALTTEMLEQDTIRL